MACRSCSCGTAFVCERAVWTRVFVAAITSAIGNFLNPAAQNRVFALQQIGKVAEFSGRLGEQRKVLLEAVELVEHFGDLDLISNVQAASIEAVFIIGVKANQIGYLQGCGFQKKTLHGFRDDLHSSLTDC